MNEKNEGWRCPVCGRVNAPFIACCPCSVKSEGDKEEPAGETSLKSSEIERLIDEVIGILRKRYDRQFYPYIYPYVPVGSPWIPVDSPWLTPDIYPKITWTLSNSTKTTEDEVY